MPVDVDSIAIAAISGKIWNVVTPIELYNLANDGVERAIHHKARHIPFRHPQLFLRHCFSLSRFTARLRRRLTARRRWLWLFRAVAPGPKGAQASIWLQRTHQAEQGRCREDETRSHPSRGAECQDSLAGSIFGRPGSVSSSRCTPCRRADRRCCRSHSAIPAASCPVSETGQEAERFCDHPCILSRSGASAHLADAETAWRWHPRMCPCAPQTETIRRSDWLHPSSAKVLELTVLRRGWARSRSRA